jgi:PAS domain-containing protein
MNEDFDVTQLALLGEATDCLQGVGIFVWDDDRTYVAVNQAACDLIGKTREEILQMRVGDLSDDRASPLVEEVQRRGVHSGRLQAPTGEIAYVTCATKIAGLPYMVSVCWRPTE